VLGSKFSGGLAVFIQHIGYNIFTLRTCSMITIVNTHKLIQRLRCGFNEM